MAVDCGSVYKIVENSWLITGKCSAVIKTIIITGYEAFQGGSDVTLSLIFLPTCRLYGLRQMLLSQIVAFLPSVSVGCRCSGTRLLLHFLAILQ